MSSSATKPLQSGLRNVHFGLTVETGTIGPAPTAGSARGEGRRWSRVLQGIVLSAASEADVRAPGSDPKLL